MGYDRLRMVCFDKINLYDIWYTGKRNIASTNDSHSIIFLYCCCLIEKLPFKTLQFHNGMKEQQIMEWRKIALKTDLFWNFWCDIKLSPHSKEHLCELMCNTQIRNTGNQLKESVNHLHTSWLAAASFNWSLHRRRCQIDWTIPIIIIIIITIWCKKITTWLALKIHAHNGLYRNSNRNSPPESSRIPLDKFNIKIKNSK